MLNILQKVHRYTLIVNIYIYETLFYRYMLLLLTYS